MKNCFKAALFTIAFFGLTTIAYADVFDALSIINKYPTNGVYYCKASGDGVCAVRTTTGQCTHHWKRESGGGDPMFYCKKFIGINIGRIDKTGWYCKDQGGHVCAVNPRHGQCTHSWKKESGGGDAMWFCKKYLGQVKSNWNPANYICKSKSTDRVCAMDVRTGQCTHEWNRKDDHDPMGSCQRFLRR